MHKLHKVKILIALVLVFNITSAEKCGGSNVKDTKTRTLIKATDDFAEGQQSVARLLATARGTGLISGEDVAEIKPFLQQANHLNEQAIALGKKLIASPDDLNIQRDLVSTINGISSILVRANDAGIFRIKDPKTKASFSLIIATMQAAITSAVTILNIKEN